MVLKTISNQVSSVRNQADQSIADWELLGDESERLRKNQKEKDAVVSELSDELDKLRQHIQTSNDTEITKTFESQYNNIQNTIQQVRSKSVLIGGYQQAPPKGEAKKLMDESRYDAAIRAYDQIIKNYPSTHTNYLGRAKAKNSLCDLAGALEDLKIAESIYPSDPRIDKLRQEFISSAIVRFSSDQNCTFNLISYDANTLLAHGQVLAAKTLYEQAKGRGMPGHYASINLTMVELLLNNPSLARQALLGFNQNLAGDYMRVQIQALESLCDFAEGKVVDLSHLRKALALCPNFSIEKSPLHFLEKGMSTLNMLNSDSKKIFSALSQNTVAAATAS
jgi:tetratricopeptide (TPR) repeat protein